MILNTTTFTTPHDRPARFVPIPSGGSTATLAPSSRRRHPSSGASTSPEDMAAGGGGDEDDGGLHARLLQQHPPQEEQGGGAMGDNSAGGGGAGGACVRSARHELQGFVALLLLGLVLGLALPKDPKLKDDATVAIISNFWGWTYFLAWSFSFYGQIVINHRRRTTEGLSFDFALLNMLGFVCYSAYSFSLLFSARIQEAYRERHGWVSVLSCRALPLCWFATSSFYINPPPPPTHTHTSPGATSPRWRFRTSSLRYVRVYGWSCLRLWW